MLGLTFSDVFLELREVGGCCLCGSLVLADAVRPKLGCDEKPTSMLSTKKLLVKHINKTDVNGGERHN